MRRQAHDIRLADRSLDVGGCPSNRASRRQSLCVFEAQRAHVDVRKLADQRQQPQMFVSLDPRADDGRHARAGPAQHACGQDGGCGGPDARDVEYHP